MHCDIDKKLFKNKGKNKDKIVTEMCIIKSDTSSVLDDKLIGLSFSRAAFVGRFQKLFIKLCKLLMLFKILRQASWQNVCSEGINVTGGYIMSWPDEDTVE